MRNFINISDITREIREIKQSAPFTISVIGNAKDLEAWKQARAEKDTLQQAKRDAEIQTVKNQLAANYIFDHYLGPSEATRKYKALVDKPKSYIPVPTHIYTYYKRPSLFQKAVTKCLEWFLEFNF